jgi:hypothetical protein
MSDYRTSPLKAKYFTRKPTGFKSKSSNGRLTPKNLNKQGWGNRQRAYGPFNTF